MEISFNLVEEYKRMLQKSFLEVTQRTSTNVA